MEGKSGRVKGSENVEAMETEYLQEAPISCDSRSNSSSTSGLIPSYTLDQSIQMQGCQGFQVVSAQVTQHQDTFGDGTYMIPIAVKSEANGTLQTYVSTQQESNMSFPMLQNIAQVTASSDLFGNSGSNQQKTGLNLQRPVCMVDGGAGNGQHLESTRSGSFRSDMQVEYGSGQSSSLCRQMDRHADMSSSSSDEKSGKCKISPKPVVRKKSCSTSSLSGEGPPSADASLIKQESGETVYWGETGFKPSLLEEILAEKKRALMRTPEMIQFLQAQQERIARAKQVSRECEQSLNE